MISATILLFVLVAGDYSVNFGATVTNKEFNVKQGNVTFLLNGHTYRVMNNGTPRIGSQAGDIASLTVTGGVFHVTPQYYLYLASDTSTGTLNVVGADTACIIDPPSYGIRCYSNATLRITGGATLRDSRFYATLGTHYIVDGGMLSNSPTFYPGQVRTGITGDTHVWVTNGGVIHAGGPFWTGGGGSTWLTLSGPNSSIRATASYLGNGAPVTELHITDGAWFDGGTPININHSGSADKTVNCILTGEGTRMGRFDSLCNVAVKSGGHLHVGKDSEVGVRLFDVSSMARVTLDGKLQHTYNLSGILTLYAGAHLQGDGVIAANPSQANYFRNNGTVSPGSPVGTLSLTGKWDEVHLDYSGNLSGNLLIELGGREQGAYDCFSATGYSAAKKITFGGTCEVVRVNGFLPKWGDTFKIIEWALLSPDKSFHAVNLPPLRWPCEWVTNDLYTAGEIRVGGPEPVKATQLMIR